ncbi:MAG: CoA pyrophosphatase [Spirochaetaceae bacterium]|nr:CoA pyrophosphatase [Spirochaetaceae bacterium]
MTLTAIEAAIAAPGAAPASRLGRPATASEAAVALVFAGADRDLRLCFIRRASHPRDPWSGQMALPGGRVAPADASLCAAAVREAREEVGLGLEHARYLGALPPIPLVRSGRPTDASVAPFAFYLAGTPPPLTVDPAEVAAGYWISVLHLRDPGQRAELRLTANGVTRRLPAVRFRRHLIWGMTYRIVTGLLERAAGATGPTGRDAP